MHGNDFYITVMYMLYRSTVDTWGETIYFISKSIIKSIKLTCKCL